MSAIFRKGDITVSVSLWRQWRFSWETWRDGYGNRMSVLDVGPLSVCVDSLPPVTVGDRGVW